ncbi:uncharacterized protein LOC144866851 [Branchiostoma floridae x Branchiostoma japonicum]
MTLEATHLLAAASGFLGMLMIYRFISPRVDDLLIVCLFVCLFVCSTVTMTLEATHLLAAASGFLGMLMIYKFISPRVVPLWFPAYHALPWEKQIQVNEIFMAGSHSVVVCISSWVAYFTVEELKPTTLWSVDGDDDNFLPDDDNIIPDDDNFIPDDDKFMPGDDKFIPDDDNIIPDDDRFIPPDDYNFPPDFLMNTLRLKQTYSYGLIYFFCHLRYDCALTRHTSAFFWGYSIADLLLMICHPHFGDVYFLMHHVVSLIAGYLGMVSSLRGLYQATLVK